MGECIGLNAPIEPTRISSHKPTSQDHDASKPRGSCYRDER